MQNDPLTSSPAPQNEEPETPPTLAPDIDASIEAGESPTTSVELATEAPGEATTPVINQTEAPVLAATPEPEPTPTPINEPTVAQPTLNATDEAAKPAPDAETQVAAAHQNDVVNEAEPVPIAPITPPAPTATPDTDKKKSKTTIIVLAVVLVVAIAASAVIFLVPGIF